MAASRKALIPRFSTRRVAQALQDTPVVMVTGPRHAGKTTLVREFVTPDRAYVTLDDDSAILGATAEGIAADRSMLGPLLETFVFAEVASSRRLRSKRNGSTSRVHCTIIATRTETRSISS